MMDVAEDRLYSAGMDLLLRRKPYILIVDDNSMILRNLKIILEKYYNVDTAQSGKLAFSSMRKRRPDLILLDYEMPEMNGKEFMLKLQENDMYKEIPIIFLTGTDSKETVVKLLSLKPAGYLLKPPDPTDMFNKINKILGRHYVT